MHVQIVSFRLTMQRGAGPNRQPNEWGRETATETTNEA